MEGYPLAEKIRYVVFCGFPMEMSDIVKVWKCLDVKRSWYKIVQVRKCTGHTTSPKWGGTVKSNEAIVQVISCQISNHPNNKEVRHRNILPSGSVFSEFPLGQFFPPFQHSYLPLPLCSKTYPSRRLTRFKLLPIHCSMISLGRGFSNDWDMSTSKRNFKFSQEVIDVSLIILDHIEVLFFQLYIKFTSGVWHGSLCPNCPPTHPQNRCGWCFFSQILK